MNPEEHEWQAQETALRDARAGLVLTDAGSQGAGYRRVVDALRVAPPSALPADFAASVARSVTTRIDADARFERRLVVGLVVAFVLALPVALASGGGASLRAVAALVPGAASPATFDWLLAALACVAASWTMGHLSTRHPARRRGAAA